MTVDGTWHMKIQTPRGEQEAQLQLSTSGSSLTGSFNDTPIENGRLTDDGISFTAKLTSPIKVKISCTATIDGDEISGKAKAALLPVAIPFSGTRATA
jgi:hypothetical protein